MTSVLHIIPADAVGGVEVAAHSLPDGCYMGLEFRRAYIAGKIVVDTAAVDLKPVYASVNNPLASVRLTYKVLLYSPDAVICSLWRSCIVGLAIKALRPQTKLVCFLHSSRSAHVADWLIHRLAIICSSAVWADSEAALRGRVSASRRNKARIISFVTVHLKAARRAKPEPKFVFWGRISPEKGLARALRLFACIRQSMPDAEFTIIGPESRTLPGLVELCSSLSINDSVRFAGPKNLAQIAEAAAENYFYLQTSQYEGMALSVVEAMQLGLLPIVTPVGEVGTYCRDGVNSFIVDDDDSRLVQRIAGIIAEPEDYRRMTSNAVAHWRGHPLYKDSVLAACRDLVMEPH